MIEWDEFKALTNFQKHHVSFSEAASSFEDKNIFLYHDVSHSIKEDRYISIAKSFKGRLLTMVFTIRRDSNGQKIYRIISARQASKKERQIYAR
jgi:uncharacterized DUF497 family protein